MLVDERYGFMTEIREMYRESYDGTALLRSTKYGAFLPTRTGTAYEIMSGLDARGLLTPEGGRRKKLFDAGSGDGTFLAVASLFDVDCFGIECDPELYFKCERMFYNLLGAGVIAKMPKVSRGNYLERRSFDSLGIKPEDIDLFYNFADGNEDTLLRFVDKNSPNAGVVFLNPCVKESDHGMAESLVLRMEDGRNSAGIFRKARP